MKIGIFDSGIGGLTVLHQAMISLPEEDYLYYADTDHVPYGIRQKEEILEFVDDALRFMLEKGIKAVIIACNTATSAAIQTLRSRYTIPILGMEPAVKPAVVREEEGKRVMVAATPLTLREEKLRNLLHQVDKHHTVDLLPLPELVRFAEREEFTSPAVEEYLTQELAPYRAEEYSALVLGCTHFNYFKDTFARLFPSSTELIDGSVGTVNHLQDILQAGNLLEHGSGCVEYYRSGRKADSPADLARYRRLHLRLEEMLRF